MPRQPKAKLDPLTGKAVLTADELRTAINRLSSRIVNERGGQVECDRLEQEMQILIAQTINKPALSVSRKTRMADNDPKRE